MWKYQFENHNHYNSNSLRVYHRLQHKSTEKSLIKRKLNIATTIAEKREDAVTNGKIMPSKQTDAADVLAVEELVHEIRENLRLKARPAHQPTRSRPSPYHIPCRSWSETTCGTTVVHHSHRTNPADKPSHPTIIKKKQPPPEETIDDPYELLQQLIKNNSLVKEAVRRLQHNLYTPKQRYFYESDEESRSPIVMMCQLES